MSRFKKLARPLLQLVILAAAAVTVGFSAVFIYLAPKLPDVEMLRDVRLQTPLRIYSQDGLLIGEFGEKRRTPVDYEVVPRVFINAFLAAEDDRFYEHHGVDVMGLLRAASQLVISGEIQTGGSTITMQVAKNYFLTRERTFSRKFNEIFLALKIERALTKAQIMELYINKIFLGNHAYGIEAASQVYYGKSMHQLDLPQIAMIAGLPKAPSAYNPLANPQRARLRRNWILGRMKRLGFIDETAYTEAVNAPLSASYHGSQLQAEAAYAAELVRQELIRRYGLDAYTEGYRVYTTIDSRLQRVANAAVVDGVAAYDWRHGYRGPTAQWELPDELPQAVEPPESGENTEPTAENATDEPAAAANEEPPPTPFTPWVKKLQKLPVIAKWHPALVIGVEDRAFNALLGNGEVVTIGWEQGLSDARRFISVNRYTTPPEKASDRVARGDVVYLAKEGEAKWRFSQVPRVQGALISLNSNNGAILSLVGGYDYRASPFNRATQAERQPGSNFKPFIYTAALAHGLTAATIINDAPIVFEDDKLESTWRPANASGQFYGPTRLRKALYNSRNLVSIRILREVGVGNAIRYASRFGFDPDKLPHNLSLALGSHSMKPIDIVEGYAVFANGGYRVTPHLIERIEDRDENELFRAAPPTVCRECEEKEAGKTIEELGSIEEILAAEATREERPPVAERVVEERVAYIMDSILQDVIKRGTGRRARQLNRDDLAGKTGTTNGPTDAWFSGYGANVVTTTWVGFDDNQLLGRGEYGGSVALPIWMDYMREALDGRPLREMKRPEGLVSVRIDPQTGKLATAGQSRAIFEIFRSEYAPTEEAESETTNGTDEDGAPKNLEIF